jgi:selenocysteine-specific elongation factor
LTEKTDTTESVRRVIVGTAGHIDHGKTRLVEALTGIDCDRWIEEKERGITIDLGFAHLREADLQVGFIDVPGHERFVHNALAGLGGIRVLLLVVAADEGVKPQTREHVDICSLLDIPGCLVALTKSDLVTDDIVELAKMEVEELLADTPFSEAQILPVSSMTGEGLPELRAHLLALAAKHEAEIEESEPCRLPVDRAFLLKGLGLVITGTLVSGRVQVGDSLDLLPSGSRVRVRSIQVHGSSREEAVAGERTALQLTGTKHEELQRGEQLVTPGKFGTTTSLAGRMTLLPDAPKTIRGSIPIRFHLYSSEVLGRLRPLAGPLEPGSTGLVEIRLQGPVTAIRGDHFIVRRPSPQSTLGGGRILDPVWHRRRGVHLAPALQALEGDRQEALALWVEEAGEAGIDTEALARRLGEEPETIRDDLAALVANQQALRIEPGPGHSARWLAPSAYKKVVDRATKVLETYFKRERLARGMPKAEAIDRILPGRSSELDDVYLGWLEAQKVLVVNGDMVNLPGRSARLTDDESDLSKAILQRFDKAGLRPPSPNEIRDELGAKPQILDGVIQYLLQNKKLARLPGGLLVSSQALDRVAEELRASDFESISVGDFKTRFDLTRKWAIPILEHLDSTGVTRRVGDARQIVRSSQ